MKRRFVKIADEILKIAEKLIKIGVEEEEEDDVLEQEIDWNDPPKLTPKLEEFLKQNGFTYEEFLRWFELFAETGAGYGLRRFVYVKRIRHLVEEFARWKKKGFDPEEAVVWVNDDWYDPEFAKMWSDADIGPKEADEWVNALDLSVDTGIDEALEWKELGFKPGEAYWWKWYKFTPEEAAEWREYGFNAGSADEYRRRGYSPESAWRKFIKREKVDW